NKQPRSRRARADVGTSAKRPAPDLGERRDSRYATTPSAEALLREELEAVWSGRTLRRGVTAVYVVDARTGEKLYAVHADDKLNPASNVKLFTAATVLDQLGPDWRYITRLLGAAPDPSGTADGSLY